MSSPNVSTEQARRLDPESRAWIERLSTNGPDRDAAIGRLHDLLLRAARFEVGRLTGGWSLPEGDDLAQQSADDALLAILKKLHDFRGDSRFTTWAYKFALYEAAVKVRRRAWQGREIPLDTEAWSLIADTRPTPHQDVETNDLLDAVRQAIQRDLTPYQRQVMVAIVLGDVPIDVLAERLGTTRGAVYKTLHDARRKLRSALAASGFSPQLESGVSGS
jgi:RNA polymerase sigma-70 factor (ECF subfamily)